MFVFCCCDKIPMPISWESGTVYSGARPWAFGPRCGGSIALHAGKVCRSRATHIMGTKTRKGKTRRSQAPRTPSEVTPPVTPRRPTPEDLPPPQCCGWDHGVSMWTLEDILTSLVPSTSENILASSGCFLSCCHCVSLRCLAQAIKH